MSGPPAEATRLQAVLFDMDGLLVDTEPLWYDVEHRVMSGLGGEWSHADQAACLGGTLAGTAEYMLGAVATAEGTGSIASAEVQHRLVTGMAERLSAGVELRPGARELLGELSAAGVATGLVSSSYRSLVDAVLAVLPGLGVGSFAVTVAGDEVAHNKPHPQAYLSAASALDAPPSSCVVLEDSVRGASAGVAAGCPTVLVPSVPGLPAPGRWLVVDSLLHLDLGRLQRYVADAGVAVPSTPTP